jgi:ribonuclease D
VAAARLTAARAGVGAIATRLGLPVENLLTPDLVRRLAWTPPAAEPQAVADALRAGGAREWQIALTAETLAEALTATPPEPEAPVADEDAPTP